jgi:stage II sporulation protein D
MKGRGYGHGVGLSQEGAMNMSRQGYSYADIIKFYYTNVIIMNIRNISFFKEE